MSEVLTLSEFIAESSNFQYSKSFYDLIKESSELALMEMYAETSMYLVENATEVAGLTGVTFMAEAATEDKGEGLVKKISEKKVGLLGKIGTMLKNAWKAIVAFFGRVANVFTNSQAKEIAKLREEAKKQNANADFTVENLKKKWKGAEGHVKELAGKLADKEDEIAILTKGKADAQDELAAFNEKFKDVDPELYRELQKVVAFLKDSYTMRAPKIVTKIEDLSGRVATVVKSYEATKTTVGNKARNLKSAKEVASLLHDIKESRVQYEDTVISAAWIKKVYEGVKADYEATSTIIDEMVDSINKAGDATAVEYKKNDVVGVRKSTDENFGEFSRNFTFLLAEFKGASAQVIRLLGEHIEKRNAAIKVQKQLLGALATA